MTQPTRLAQPKPRARAARRWLACIAALAAAAPLGGCAIGGAIGYFANAIHEAGSTEVPAEYVGLQGRSFAVVVTADPSLRASEPRAITRVTNAVTRLLAGNAGATGVVPGQRVLEFQYTNPSWPSWSYQRLADEFTVDRLVVVELYEYRLHEPGNAYLWKGQAAARVGVFESGTGSEEFAYMRDVIVAFPGGEGYTRDEISKNGVSATLEMRLTNRVAWLFFDHEEPNTIEY